MRQTGGQSVLRARVQMPSVRGIGRPRLTEALEPLWQHRLGLVVAPAGSGKTTLAAHFAASAPGPVAWYRAEASDSSESALVAHLESAVTAAFPGLPAGWERIDDAVAALERWAGEPALLVVDDLHALWGTEAEEALERLIRHLPPGVVVLAATRRAPAFDLSRLRVSEELLELGPDHLRFRSWEVEQLFRDFYEDRLPPEELAQLARRTGGWAAGLQLFHLATRGKPAVERRRLLRELAGQSRMVREYLARNVLEDLDAGLRSFLLETCVLGVLTPALCDQLLGRSGSAAVLEELEHRRIFTSAYGDDGGYRYHEVLRSHLEAVLVERDGDEPARARYQRAGSLLEAAGALPDALRAYCRADDWPAARRLLGLRGEQLVAGPGAWIEALSPSLLEHDPWLLLATARRYAALGSWEAAVEAYQRAAGGFGPGAPQETCRRERHVLASWFDPHGVPSADWTGVLRRASRRDPLREAATPAAGVAGQLAAGLCLLLGGRAGDAERVLAGAAEQADATPVLAIAAGLAEGVAASLSGNRHRLTEVAEEAELFGFPWLAGLARAARRLDAGGDLDPSRSHKTEPWGVGLAALFSGLGALRSGGDPVEELTDAANAFRSVGAGVPEAWARAALALAEARRSGPAALPAARGAQRFAEGVGAYGAVGLAYAALAAAQPGDPGHAAAVRAMAQDTGLAILTELLDDVPARPPAPDLPAASVSIRCFGRFELAVDGRPIELSTVRPRARAVLRLLACHAGRPVHREQILEALWPGEADARAATRSLQVAVSSLRQLLDAGDRGSLLARNGESYRLALGEDADVDVLRFEQAVAAGHAAMAAGDPDRAAHSYEEALALHAGDLFPVDGPAEWVVVVRERYHRDAASAAAALAGIELRRGDPRAAAAWAERGLLVDRYDDNLWRMLAEGHERAGDHAGAELARKRYRTMLQELGVSS
ncbi:MAG TPA: BTAD domain-containing putative transcriptional regulator [Acidimicrobiales bacterium]|nr:BTAD domain-containing putative transcriptional regulator [Acidimicrobiales bacterium]